MHPENREKLYTSGVMATVPVIRGTRVSLVTLIEYLEDDDRGLQAFLADHPQVSPAQANRTLVVGLQTLIERREGVIDLGGGDPTTPAPGGASSTGK